MAVEEEQDLTLPLALEWIGFNAEPQCQAIIEDLFSTLEEVADVDVGDIDKVASSFAKRPAAQRIIFGHRRTKFLKLFIHWAQDFECVSEDIAFHGTRQGFLNELRAADDRSKVRAALAENSDTMSREASPGDLENERKWAQWEPGLTNYLSCIPGSNGVPLSYVIRENDDPLDDEEIEGMDFTQQCVACCPLEGPHFEVDKRKVHQLIQGFTNGTSAEDWIKPHRRCEDGRLDMQALRDHFKGEGNASRQIAEAERLKATLHYKSERSFSFETFLTKIQKMKQIYEEYGEPMTEDALCRFIFEKTEHPGLAADVAALKAQKNTVGVSFTSIANQLSAAVSLLPESVAMKSRNVSAASTSEGTAPASGIRLENGAIYTGYYKNWGSLSKEDRQLVLSMRPESGQGGGNKFPKRRTSATKAQKKLKKRNKALKRQVAALKKKKASEGGSDSSSDDQEPAQDSGTKFGGRASKRAKKKE